ncbi:MAG: hypothetical protein ACI865_002737 [Flavobacteriaceae bacterium]|jgi:hypothetical protein
MKYILITFSAIALLYSCAPKVAEVVEISEGTTEASTGLSDPQIAGGKVIWENDCTVCHYGKKVITDYTKEQWRGILPKMVINAKLDEAKTTEIHAYVYWVLENQ